MKSKKPKPQRAVFTFDDATVTFVFASNGSVRCAVINSGNRTLTISKLETESAQGMWFEGMRACVTHSLILLERFAKPKPKSLGARGRAHYAELVTKTQKKANGIKMFEP